MSSFRYSGLVHNKTVGIVPAADKKGFTLVYKKKHNPNKPAKNVAKVFLFPLTFQLHYNLNTIGFLSITQFLPMVNNSRENIMNLILNPIYFSPNTFNCFRYLDRAYFIYESYFTWIHIKRNIKIQRIRVIS